MSAWSGFWIGIYYRADACLMCSARISPPGGIAPLAVWRSFSVFLLSKQFIAM
jgi:hypothetical protein